MSTMHQALEQALGTYKMMLMALVLSMSRTVL